MTAWVTAAWDRAILQTGINRTKPFGKFVYDFNEKVSLSRILFFLTHCFQLMSTTDHSHHSYHHMQCPIKPVVGTSWRGGDVCL